MRIYFRTQSQADKYFAICKEAISSRMFKPVDPNADPDKGLPWQRIRNTVSQGLGYASFEELTYIYSSPHEDWNHNQYDLFQATREALLKVQDLAQSEGFRLDRLFADESLGFPDYSAWNIARGFYSHQETLLADRHFGEKQDVSGPDSLWPLKADTFTVFPALWAAWTATPYLTVVNAATSDKAAITPRQLFNDNFANAFFYWGEALPRIIKTKVREGKDLVEPGHRLHHFGVYFSAALETTRENFGYGDTSGDVRKRIASGIHHPIELAWCEYGFQMILRAVTSAVPETYALWETADSALCHFCLTRYRSKTATTKKELSTESIQHGWKLEKSALSESPKLPATPTAHFYVCPQCKEIPQGDLYLSEPTQGLQAERKRNFENEVGRMKNLLPEEFFSGGYRSPALKSVS
jgi:hypothetical protein